MSMADLLRRATRCRGDHLEAAGNAIRAELERAVRADPRRLPVLYDQLRRAGERNRAFRPWAQWAEGTAEQLRGHPARAAPLLERASGAFRSGSDEHTAARVDLMLMDALACLGRYRSAERTGRRAMRAFTVAGDNPRVAAALTNLGGLASTRDRVRDALLLWRRARSHLGSEDGLRRALVDANLAAGLQSVGRFRGASRLYARAARELEAAGASASALQPLLGLAEVGILLGEVGDGLVEIDRIAGVATEIGDDNILFEARLIQARAELSLGQAERARAVAESTGPLCEAAGRRDDQARFAAVAAVAVAAGAEGDLEQARERALRLLRATGQGVGAAWLRVELARRTGAPGIRRLREDAATLERAGLSVQADLAHLCRASVLAGSGRATSAERLCRAVLARRQVSVWPRFEARRLLADLVGRRDAGAAVRHLRAAVRVAESVRARLGAEGDRAALSRRTVEAYERLVEELLRRGDGRSRRQAFELVARVKSRSLLEALDSRRDQQWRESPEIVQRWNAMRQELAAMLAALEDGPGERSRYSTAVVERRVRRLSRQLESLEVELARSKPAFGAALGSLPAPALRPMLEPGEVFLELFLSNADLILFRLTRSGLTVTVNRGARGRLEKLLATTRFQLSKAAYGRRHLESPGSFLVDQARTSLAELGELLLSPLEGQPAPRTLYIAPHGELHNLPLAALELGGAPILAACPVAVAPSSGILARILDGPLRRPQRLGVAGAGPAELPEIDREVAELARRLPAAEVIPNAGVADMQALLGGCDAVHVASHGAFQPLIPSGSGLRLRDGWLTALDILKLDIRVRTVTISACASGRVAVLPGEEVAGFVRALLASGVRTAIVAPGALDDNLARRAAEELYSRLLGAGPGQALREALLGLRDEYPHPALWAGLQLYGNPRCWKDSP